MTMVARWRVATRTTGMRRQVFVHVYDDRLQLARVHSEARKRPFNPDAAGGVAIQQGYRWPRPEVTPIMVMRLWTGQLTAETIAHESVHCAAAFYFMDRISGWDSRIRTTMLGDHEPLAYCVGHLTELITSGLEHRGLINRRAA
jgi:hypothetical protein